MVESDSLRLTIFALIDMSFQYSAKFVSILSVEQKRVPEYKTMFSELRHHPRFSVRLDVTDPVPKFINREWRGYADQHREAMTRYTTYVVITSEIFKAVLILLILK